ncbi:MAG: DUF5947 family protein [Candidatus Acidiferrales bacterium]
MNFRSTSQSPTTGPIARLRRYAPKSQPARERCELCGLGLGSDHQHLIEPATRSLLCTCEACSLLFTSKPGTKLRRVPRRGRFLPNFRLSESQWNGLQIPIELVFFFHGTPVDRMIAMYPSPAGATESLLPLELWDEIVRENQVLSELTPDVEALLVNRVGAERGVPCQYFIAPIDECYRLAGLIRMHWRGLSGGTEVWREIAGFFSALKERSEIVAESVHA